MGLLTLTFKYKQDFYLKNALKMGGYNELISYQQKMCRNLLIRFLSIKYQSNLEYVNL